METSQIVTIIQARQGSSRLPGKIMLPLAGEPLLVRMAERVIAAKTSGTVVVATTILAQDDPVEALCMKYELNCFRGHPTDLLDRHFRAGKYYNAKAVVKIPSDCPLIDPRIIDRVIGHYIEHQHQLDYAGNLHPASWPDGNDVEIMSLEALHVAYREAEKDFEREHTTPFIWERPERFRLANICWESGLDYSMSHRWTIDYPEDYQFISKVYDELFHKHPGFGLDEILELLQNNPGIAEINSKFAGVNWYRHHLSELKTIKPGQTKKL